MWSELWSSRIPSKRCEWIDQLRGWAVIIMIEVHCVNVWLKQGLLPDWLNYLNGLVAPSFLLAAGFSLPLSTFHLDGDLRSFRDSARRLLFILLCAYALHAPGITLAEWTVLSTPQKLLEVFKIDVLQCVVFSLLILQGLARVIKRPLVFALVALALALYIPLISPYLWASGVGDGLWMPIRGLLNGNPDRGVSALFPLFPWLAFPAFGCFLGVLYRHWRVLPRNEGQASWSEGRWLLSLMVLGGLLLAFGHHFKTTWLWDGQWVQNPGTGTFSYIGTWKVEEMSRLHNTTLPSILERMGWISLGGALMGVVERLRGKGAGINPVESASKESLLLYMLHLNLIFGLMLQEPFLGWTGWDWNTQGWLGTCLITLVVMAFNLAAGVAWQRIRKEPMLMRRIQRWGLACLAVWFLAGGWWTFRHYLKSPELAREPYPFLHAARERKGLPPTPDGLCRDPEEYFRETARIGRSPKPEMRRRIEDMLQRRREKDRR